jgi:hypothetical protein
MVATPQVTGLERLAQRRRRQHRSADALQVVHVREPVQRRERHLPEALEAAGDTRQDRGQGEAVGIRQEGVDLVGPHVLALHELETGVVGQVAARPAELLGRQRLVAIVTGHAVGRRKVPAELEGRVAERVHAQRVVVAGVAVGDSLDPRREVVLHERHQRHAVRLLERDNVVEALLALRVEFGVRPQARWSVRGRRTHRPPP